MASLQEQRCEPWREPGPRVQSAGLRVVHQLKVLGVQQQWRPDWPPGIIQQLQQKLKVHTQRL